MLPFAIFNHARPQRQRQGEKRPLAPHGARVILNLATATRIYKSLGTTVINGTSQFLWRSAHLAKSMSKTDAANEYFRIVGAVQRDEAALAATIRTLHAIPRLRRFTPEVEIESTATGINVKPLLTKRRLTKRPRSVAAEA